MKVLKYLFTFLFIISAVGAVINGSAIAGLLLGVLGIILLPPISEILAHKVRLWNSKIARYGFYALIFILVGSTIKKTPKVAGNGSTYGQTEKKAGAINKSQEEQSTSQEISRDNSDFWKKFDPIVKERIYKLIKEKDCTGLQEEFKVTADNMDRIQADGGGGSRNLDLMTFLEYHMQNLGCH